jgi:hypothetical protein
MDKSARQLVSVSPMPVPAVIDDDFIKSRIFTIRGVQVMLDRDLARIYGVTTSRLNEQVKRNAERFPANFMFRLSPSELGGLKSQNATSSSELRPNDRLKSQNATSSWGGIRKPSAAFTEHGVIMLASVLRSDSAVAASVRITEAFVAMRKALASIAPLLNRIDVVERRQIADQARNEERFDTIFKAMDGGDFPPQKIFYDGQLWDARAFVDKLVKRARKSLVLVDSWATVETLDMLAAKQKGVAVTVVTSEHRDRKGNPRPKILPADIAKFNAQYPTLSIRFRENFHDRFLVIDDRELYLVGASLKDLGRKCFGFTRMDTSEIPGLKARM